MKLKGPLLSLSAHGKFAQSLIYSKKKTGQIGRQYHYPKTPASQKQLTQRTIIGLLTAHWQIMSAGEKEDWNALAQKQSPQITGFNLWIKTAQTDLPTYHGLQGYWSSNELSGETVFDYSGNGNHGTLKPSFPSNVPQRVDSLNEKFGKALSFNAVDNYVSIPASNSLDFSIPNKITIIAWIYMLGLGGGNYNLIIQQGGWNGFWLRVKPNGYLEMEIGTGNLPDAKVLPGISSPMFYNTWYNVAGTFDGSVMTLYVDGKFVRSVGTAITIGFANTALKIGGYWQWFNGPIDETRLYNRALSSEEIQKQYQLLRSNTRRQPLLQ